jgi:nitrogen fixation/metabolism regulation signal transduction histidine kinase
MLISLEDSKNALKNSEKEKAWREAAQQVAHEIKNPLTPMKLTLQLISKKINDNKVTPKALEIPLQSVLDQVETLNSIASSFSEFAKMPSPIIERVEVHELLKKAAELFSGEKELDIKLILDPRNVYCLADPKLLSRIFNNLLLNSKESIKQNQQAVEVEVTTKLDNYLVIEIADNGAGIEEDIMDKVFIPRFTTKEQGSGIGLAMIKHGIENMRGNIYINSEVEKGTTFIIELPIAD